MKTKNKETCLCGSDKPYKFCCLVHNQNVPTGHLPGVQIKGSFAFIASPCGFHQLSYPLTLGTRAIYSQKRSIFKQTCPCDKGYIVEINPDRSVFQSVGHIKDVFLLYESLPWNEEEIELTNGQVFRYRSLPHSTDELDIFPFSKDS